MWESYILKCWNCLMFVFCCKHKEIQKKKHYFLVFVSFRSSFWRGLITVTLLLDVIFVCFFIRLANICFCFVWVFFQGWHSFLCPDQLLKHLQLLFRAICSRHLALYISVLKTPDADTNTQQRPNEWQPNLWGQYR